MGKEKVKYSILAKRWIDEVSKKDYTTDGSIIYCKVSLILGIRNCWLKNVN